MYIYIYIYKWWDGLKNDAVKQYFLKNPTQVSASDDMS